MLLLLLLLLMFLLLLMLLLLMFLLMLLMFLLLLLLLLLLLMFFVFLWLPTRCCEVTQLSDDTTTHETPAFPTHRKPVTARTRKTTRFMAQPSFVEPTRSRKIAPLRKRLT